jgi:acetyl-CoA carboxylase carboxyltransferase component
MEAPDPNDLEQLLRRRALTEDAARPDAVARRHASGGRTARENVEDLIDPGSWVEYGRFAIAAQRKRRDVEELIARTPADGLVAGTARVGGRPIAVLAYDYTVLAGTQGMIGHAKKDRLFELIERLRLPVVFFAEGGGGRPGDTDLPGVSWLHTRAFAMWARLAGTVPRIAIVHGRCFAGNAVIAGCSDLIVATSGASLGMGGPAMIAGGGRATSRRTTSARWRCRRPTGSSTSWSPTRPRRWRRRSGCCRVRPTTGPPPTRRCCATRCPRARAAPTTSSE